jgi:hypothetical protein
VVDTLQWVAAGLFGGLAISGWVQYSRTKSSGPLRLALLFTLACACFLAAGVLRAASQ